jgi:hypothetical protein
LSSRRFTDALLDNISYPVALEILWCFENKLLITRILGVSIAAGVHIEHIEREKN